ncbi:hypothetical protein COO60DRAFT_1549891 [Scenedesmus sp. NREL 46B-D3]|nr:hypothetical protein COO60DRAFT_1549891 [Scenedesmus sp. NREL 46B-D3]
MNCSRIRVQGGARRGGCSWHAAPESSRGWHLKVGGSSAARKRLTACTHTTAGPPALHVALRWYALLRGQGYAKLVAVQSAAAHSDVHRLCCTAGAGAAGAASLVCLGMKLVTEAAAAADSGKGRSWCLHTMSAADCSRTRVCIALLLFSASCGLGSVMLLQKWQLMHASGAAAAACTAGLGVSPAPSGFAHQACKDCRFVC